MPNRIIKETICTSENVDQLTPFQENVFIRLIVNCDDFGRFDGRVKVLASRLFPLKDISCETMLEAVEALEKADLVTVYKVNGRPYVQLKTWLSHQTPRAKKSKYPSPDEGTCEHLQADENICKQMQADDDKCARIRIRESIIDNRYSLSDSLIGEEDAANINADHDKVLSAAENAGFARNDATRAKLIDLYAVHGLQKVLDGLNSCVEHGVSNVAYLSAVLKGEPKKVKISKAGFSRERAYDDEQEDAERRMFEGLKEAGVIG